jgi:putative ABC transport system ATP-binding protein
MSIDHANSGPLLSLARLRKTVPGGRLLFSGLDITLNRGEAVAIKGESGSGKSTLLNIIAGIDTADAGNVVLTGVSLETLSEDQRTLLRRTAIGFIFQAFHVLPHLTLAQNVALPLLLQQVGDAEAHQRAGEMLASVGLPGRGNEFPGVLSGGELQRVAIARALVHRPSLILADEPTGNLDPDTARDILALFSSRVRALGSALILVTHSNLAAAIADRIFLLTQHGLYADHASALAAD